MSRIGDRARVVHARKHHHRDVTARAGRIDRPGRVVDAVEEAPLVGVDAAHFLAGEVLEGNRQVGRRELLTELRRERVELGGKVVGDRAREVPGDVRRGEHVELRERRHLRLERDLLAVAQRTHGTGERRLLSRTGEQAIEVRHGALRAHAGPEHLDRAGITLVPRHGAVVCSRLDRVVGVVGRTHRCLVGHDEDVAEACELLRHRGDEGIPEQDVLVLLLDELVAIRHHDLDHVLAGGQHRRAIDRVRHADRAVSAVPGRVQLQEGFTGGRVLGAHAREAVHAGVGSRLDLVEHRPAVVALEASGRGDRRGVQPHRAVLHRVIEGARGLLARAVHVGDGLAIGPELQAAVGVSAEALRPVVPVRSRRGIHQRQALAAIRRDAFLVEIYLDVGDAGLPAQLQQQRRIVERTRGGVDHVTTDAAVLRRRRACGIGERPHGEFDEAVLAEQALPAFAGNVARINASGGAAGDVVFRTVGAGAVARTRDLQFRRQVRGRRFDRVRQAGRNRGDAASLEGCLALSTGPPASYTTCTPDCL